MQYFNLSCCNQTSSQLNSSDVLLTVKKSFSLRDKRFYFLTYKLQVALQLIQNHSNVTD